MDRRPVRDDRRLVPSPFGESLLPTAAKDLADVGNFRPAKRTTAKVTDLFCRPLRGLDCGVRL